MNKIVFTWVSSDKTRLPRPVCSGITCSKACSRHTIKKSFWMVWNQNWFVPPHACFYKNRMAAGLRSDLENVIVFRCKLANEVYEMQQNSNTWYILQKEECFLFKFSSVSIIKTNSLSNINTVEVSNWQEIKEMVISFLTIVPFIPLADLGCQNELPVWQHSLFPEPVPEC